MHSLSSSEVQSLKLRVAWEVEKAGSHDCFSFEACCSALRFLAGRQTNAQEQENLGRIEGLDVEAR